MALTGIAPLVFALGRPLAGGYRIAQLCLDRQPRLGRRRRRSPLCTEAARLAIGEREAAVERTAGVRFRPDVPLDALVKSSLWFAIGYTVVTDVQFGDGPQIEAPRVVAWVLASALLLVALDGLGRAAGSLRRRVPGMRFARFVLACAGLAAVGWLALAPAHNHPGENGWGWLVTFAVVLSRLAWLAVRVPGSGRGFQWLGMPLLVVVALGIAARAPDTESLDRRYALETMAVQDLPQVGRADLQVLLASHRRLTRADLRTQDLHAMSLRDKDLSGAQLLLANLARADLRGADLRGADLRGADLRAVTALAGADLLGADQRAALAEPRPADLREADLRCANLEGTDLRGAWLDGARLRGAVADERTRWPDGFDRGGLGITDEHAIASHSDLEYSFYGHVASCLSPAG